MSEKVRIKDNPHLLKDMNNFAILNTDRSAIAAHKLKIAEIKRKKQIDDEINNLKSEISEVKNMLGAILKAVNGEK